MGCKNVYPYTMITAGGIFVNSHNYYSSEQSEDNDSSPASEMNEKAELIERTGQSVSENSKHLIHCLTIIGQIEGHYAAPPSNKTTKYEHIMPALVAIEQDRSIEGLLIILNTVGGDVEAGLAIAELISGMKKPSVSLVLGGGHSIGIPLAVSADRSFIVPSASMTVHPVRMNGLVIGVPQTLLYLKKMEERVVNFVTQNSSVTAARFRELMLNNDELISDFGTVLGGLDAVNEGLIDRIGGLSDALDCLDALSREYKNNMI